MIKLIMQIGYYASQHPTVSKCWWPILHISNIKLWGTQPVQVYLSGKQTNIWTMFGKRRCSAWNRRHGSYLKPVCHKSSSTNLPLSVLLLTSVTLESHFDEASYHLARRAVSFPVQLCTQSHKEDKVPHSKPITSSHQEWSIQSDVIQNSSSHGGDVLW